MPLTGLRKLIDRFKVNKDDTPIALNDINARACAIQEITEICSKEVHAFIFFDEDGESELFDALADEQTSRQLSKFLNHSTINIATNDTAKVKHLSFVSRNLSESTKKLIVTPIPKKLASEIIKNTLDNEFFLAAPEHLIFVGRYDIPSNERLAEVSSFLNLFDSNFYNSLLRYFDRTVSRAKDGEFR